MSTMFCYVRYDSSQGILNNLLKSNFSAINLRKSFKDCSNTEKISVHQRLVARYDELTNKPFFVNNDVITTHSNPSSEEISEILSSIGITTDIFNLKKFYIDFELLSKRHKVVHGERYEIQKKEFEATFKIIMELVDDFETVIIKAADSKEYLK